MRASRAGRRGSAAGRRGSRPARRAPRRPPAAAPGCGRRGGSTGSSEGASLGPDAGFRGRVPLLARIVPTMCRCMHALLLLASITDKVVEPIVDVATEFIGSAGRRRGLPADDAGVGLHPDAERGDHALRRLQRLQRRTDPVRDRRRRGARQPGRLLDRLRGRLLRPPRPAGKEPADPHQPQAPRNGPTTGSSATATRPSSSPGCCRSSAPSSRCRPGSRRCRSGASPPSPCSAAIPWVLALALIGEEVGDNWEEWRHNLGYLDYVVLAAIVAGVVYLVVRRRRGGGPGEDGDARRDARAGRNQRRLSEAGEAGCRPGARSRWASSRARPSCCRSPAPPTSSSSPGSPAGTGRRSTRSCARASRWRCTPAPRRRC